MLTIAERLGWDYALTKKGSHYRLTKPGCAVVFCSGTASDKRAIKNLECMLKRAERGEAT
jgi:predicted RNA binding protein YcfA (HicA-like mRNA interferase family)